jgi:tetratricopeptide (TPR) repeat protein
MDSDDQLKQTEEERKRMLEAIRRRSEEAELKRLEDEEVSIPDPEPASPAPAESPLPFAPPPAAPSEDEAPFAPPVPREFSSFPIPESIPSSLSAEEQQRALILKEKFLIAIDRGKAEKASEILSELNLVLPHEEILELREKLRQLEEEVPRARGKKRQAEPSPESHAPPPERPRVAEQRDQRKKIAEFLETVNSAYQQEKYTAALEGIAEILRLDSENEEALRLKEEILRAQQLAEQIAREDEKRRKEEAAARSALKRSEIRSGRIPSERRSGMQVPDKDFWGSSVNPPDPLGLEVMPEEKGPAAPPRPPILDRIAGQIVRIKIPVKPLLIGLAVIAAVVIIYLIVDNIRNAVAPPLYSVLVLPPTVTVGDSSLGGVAEGLAVDLSEDLYSVSDLRVVGMSTAYALDASALGSLQRCRVVASNFFLRWSLSQQGDALLLQAELNDTAASKPVWSSRKVSSMRELARMKTELALALVAAMNVKVSDEEQQALKAIPTSNEYAYTAYLRARSMMRHPDSNPIGAVIQVLGESVTADSAFGRAQSALGWAHLLAYEGGDRVATHLAEARARVQRAVSLVLRNPEAHRVWGVAELLQGQCDKAVERLEQAVAIAPSDVESQRRLAVAYVVKNQPDAALKAANRGVNDDPWVETTHTTLAQVQQFIAIVHGESREDYRTALRSYEQAMRFASDRSEYGSAHVADMLVITQQPERALSLLVDRLARARQSYQDLYILGRVEQSAGKPKTEWQDAFVRAEELLKAVLAAHPEDALAHSQVALVHTRLGEFREAVAANQRALKLAPTDPAVLYNTARMYAMQNDKQQAKEFLTRAIDRYYSLPDILDRDLTSLHTEPDFVKIVTR